jgi:hypothetical protein
MSNTRRLLELAINALFSSRVQVTFQNFEELSVADLRKGNLRIFSYLVATWEGYIQFDAIFVDLNIGKFTSIIDRDYLVKGKG